MTALWFLAEVTHLGSPIGASRCFLIADSLFFLLGRQCLGVVIVEVYKVARLSPVWTVPTV